jgi:triose/dihydroxyacetone kinase / FAD-AMP lyase (cyclizing)
MCGGGSGHEPAHAGFVGKMATLCFWIMLISCCISRPRHAHEYVTESVSYQLLESILSLGAVCGNVFASPNAQQVKRGIDLIDNDIG